MLASAKLSAVPPWAVNALLGSALLAGLLMLLRQHRDIVWARGSAILLCAGNPYFLLNSASYHSHVLSALLVLGFCVALTRAQRHGAANVAFVAGLLFAAALTVRYIVLVAMLPALLAWATSVKRGRSLCTLIYCTLGAAPVVALLLVYQKSTTGSYWKTTYAVISRPDVFPSIATQAVINGLELTFYRLLELAVWTSPACCTMLLLSLAVRLRHRSLNFLDYVLPGFVAAYIFFPELGGNRYGPRYYFDAFPVAIVSTLIATGTPTVTRMRNMERIAVHLTAAALICGLVSIGPALFAYHHQIERRQEPFRLAAERGLVDAVVIVDRQINDGMITEDLARNGATLDSSVLFARRGTNADELKEAFPSRSIWLYTASPGESQGRLDELVPAMADE
ncbi:MAG TPA: hypothetical protein PJ986_04925 [Gammaproteobacteria bacterium]|nr:hypothetical protein [Gammaproteobacteria bacterium]